MAPVSTEQSQLGKVVDPLGGLISRVERVLAAPGGRCPFAFCAILGDLRPILPNVGEVMKLVPEIPALAGVGMSWNEDSAWIYAATEAIERYSASSIPEERIRWGTANELGGIALDLATVARCSQDELGHPHCPVLAPDSKARIRWVKGFSLMSLSEVWIPAIMVYIRIPKLVTGERFWMPTSSGCAAHPDVQQALVNAICELIERDAVALLWLQRLALPRLEIDCDAPILPRRRSEILLYDATTDVGVPTIYAVDSAPDASEVATLVCSCTSLDPQFAFRKVLAEATLYRLTMDQPSDIPLDPDYFTQPIHGAVFMSHPKRQDAFRFLTENGKTRKISNMPCIDVGSPCGNLRSMIDRFTSLGMEAFAVDLTTHEARRAGLHVVRVLVPALQPLTYSLRARYLAHPRLYDAPVRMGYPVSRERDLNPWPQPFG